MSKSERFSLRRLAWLGRAFLLVLLSTGCATDGNGPEAGDIDAGRAEARAHTLMELDPPDWEGARAAFQEAAGQGSATAMSYLGWMYEEGHGVPANGRRAADWYVRAAEAGALDFAVKLGWMYLGGQGIERDRAEAERWFGYAVAADYSPGRIAWASVLIADALGGRNPERVYEARELLQLALEDDHLIASFFLARLYIEGIGGHPIDDAAAARYTRIGAETGNSQMQGWLAFMYLQGRGVDQDPVTAATWANLAAAGGDTLGEQVRQVLEQALSPEQVEQARRRAVDWALRQP
jgi:TPR repeat protein